MELPVNSFTPLYMTKIMSTKESYNVLWHYTNLKGLMGILSDSKTKGIMTFRFTRSDCLNDKSEGQDVVDCLASVGKSLFQMKRIDDIFFKSTQNVTIPNRRVISYPYFDDSIEEDEYKEGTMIDIAECEAFLCCFSIAGNQLDMWRYYSKTGDGYAMAFVPDFLFYEQEEYMHSEKVDATIKYITIKKLDILYNFAEKEEYLESILLKAFEAYQKELKTNGKEKAQKSLESFLGFLVQENQYRFKHPCFANEKEYRYIAYRPIEKPKRLANDLPEVKYREQYGALVPYIEISCATHALVEIQISPYINLNFAERTLKEYLNDSGLSRVRTSHSHLPVQF